MTSLSVNTTISKELRLSTKLGWNIKHKNTSKTDSEAINIPINELTFTKENENYSLIVFLNDNGWQLAKSKDGKLFDFFSKNTKNIFPLSTLLQAIPKEEVIS